MAASPLERKLSIGTWVLTAVHVVWFYFYWQALPEPGSFFSFSVWWGFCKTLPGAATMILAFGCSIAQCIVMFRTPLDDSKIIRRKPKDEAGDTPE